MLKDKMTRYAFFDGDNIGNTINNLLNNNRIEEASHLSEKIKYAVYEIEQIVSSNNDVELIIAGGDDILIKYNIEKNDYIFLNKISDIFTKHTGLSMSCGVGNNIEQAINNIVDAKEHSKGEIKSGNLDVKIQESNVKHLKLYIFTTSDVPDPYINV